MQVEKFDYVIIGGGSAGYAAARTAREQSESVAIVDNAAELGGLCILRGCMPSKTLIYSAEILHGAQIGARFGLKIPEARADMAEVHARKVRMIDDFKSYRQEQLASDRFSLFRERASFIDKETVELQPSGRLLRAKTFFISTGSTVNHPPVEGLKSEGIWTSDDILDLDTLPESVIMLGGGIVACELAQFLQRMGTKVTQIQRSPRILKEMSPEASAVVEEAFRDGGIDVITDTQLTLIERSTNGYTVHFMSKGKERSVSAQYVCNALGRRPNVDGLNLQAAGIEQQRGGHVVVDQFQRTSNAAVYAGGDVTGPYEIVHLAIMHGELAIKHARGESGLKKVDYENRTGVVFTDPQVATAGQTVEECEQEGIELLMADYPFNDHGKSMLMEANYGYVKAWADKKTGRLLGAECVGKDAGELIHAMAVAVSLKADIESLVKVHWYHPTLSEIWSYPLEDILEEL